MIWDSESNAFTGAASHSHCHWSSRLGEGRTCSAPSVVCADSLGKLAQRPAQPKEHFKAKFPDACWGPSKEGPCHLFLHSVSLQCCFLACPTLTPYSSFQFEPQLHRPDWVSLHVALLLPADLLWRHADHRQCHDPQWHGCHRKNCRQGEIAFRLVVNLALAQTFVP